VVNRCFAADDGKPDELMKTLDRDVTVIDPREAEAAFRREFKDVRTLKDAERAAAEMVERRITSREDVPMVEDFPLAPEEETPEFRDLATALQLRLVRAVEQWRGNKHLTLTAIIVRTVQENARSKFEDLALVDHVVCSFHRAGTQRCQAVTSFGQGRAESSRA